MKKTSFLYENSLSLALGGLFLLFILAQALTGRQVHNQDLIEKSVGPIGFIAYLHSGHFLQATFENWESEFLQMFVYVWLTVYLKQKGSSESKPLYKKSEVDNEPKDHSNAPWPVRHGGWVLKVYKHSLGLAFLFLFLLSFCLHAYGSYKSYKTEQILQHLPMASFSSYLMGSRFWFESFQNWQSEFLAVFSIVVPSIFLRHQGSPESKPVDARHDKNE